MYQWSSDGRRCWLCEERHQKWLDICHQIDSADEEAFARLKAEGTLPESLTDTSHKDNLFPLCVCCHRSYDAGSFTDWILTPDESTLQKYIGHEKENYAYRQYLVSQATTMPTSKSLWKGSNFPVGQSLGLVNQRP